MPDTLYVGGPITLDNGDTEFTLSSGALLTNALRGDTLEIAGVTGTIALVGNDTTATLLYPWAGDSVVDEADYVIKLNSRGWFENTPGLTGDPGPVGQTGASGRDGSNILIGTGAPAADLGDDGDYYVSTDPVAHYYKSPETSTWSLITYLSAGPTGPQGERGETGLTGGAGPIGATGAAGATGSGLQPDAVGEGAAGGDRDLYDAEAEGFIYWDILTAPAAIYVKASNTSADWSGPHYLGGEFAIGDWGAFPGIVDTSFDLGTFP